MRTEIIEILQKAYPEYCLKHIDTANEILRLFNVNNSTCDHIFEHASKVDDYDFNLHQHWKDEDDRTGFDSKPIGGFNNW